jgi:DNA-binding CsgD family transcriptional regulator
VLLGRLFERQSAEIAAFDTLDGLSTAVCLVEASGQIVHANAACRTILDADDFLSGAGGRLAASDASIDQALRELFAADPALEPQRISLPLRARDGTHYVMHALPLTSGARPLAEATCAATAALFIRKTATEPPSAPEIIARAYNLTPTELRVLLAIAEIGGVPEVAVALGVAETTIKTHLGRLFAKTGGRRQADLVKIVAGFANPLLG